MTQMHDGIDDYEPANPTETKYAQPLGDHGQGQPYEVQYAADRPDFDQDPVRTNPENYFAGMPSEWLSKAAPKRVRENTVYLIAGGDPVQILRRNDTRRSATVLFCNIGDNTAAPVAVSHDKSALSNQYLKNLGAYTVGNSLPQGSFALVPVSPQSITYNSTGDLFAVAPWTTTGAYFVSVVEYYD